MRKCLCGTKNEPIVIRDDNDERPKVLSFDLGENATAYCLGRISDHGDKHTIDGVGVATLGVICSARDATLAICDLLWRLPKADFYIIEEQPCINSKTRMLETALATLISTVKGSVVVHVPTSRMTNAYHLPVGHDNRKRAGFKIGMELLKSNRFLVNEEVFSVISSVKRKHDITDAVIQYGWFVTTGISEILEISKEQPECWSFRATAPSNRATEKRKETTKRLLFDKKFQSIVERKRGKKVFRVSKKRRV